MIGGPIRTAIQGVRGVKVVLVKLIRGTVALVVRVAMAVRVGMGVKTVAVMETKTVEDGSQTKVGVY